MYIYMTTATVCVQKIYVLLGDVHTPAATEAVWHNPRTISTRECQGDGLNNKFPNDKGMKGTT